MDPRLAVDMSLSGSLNKCERDIPRLDPSGGIANFLAAREAFIGEPLPASGLREQMLHKLDVLVTEIARSYGGLRELREILAQLWLDERSNKLSDDNIIYRLQKKFALFGRLAFCYDACMTKADERLAGREELALFAALLLLRFSRNGSLNELNSALKLVDQALSMEAPPGVALRAALILERDALGGLL